MLCAVLSQLRAAMEALRGRQVRTERALSEREEELVRAKEAAEKASEAKSRSSSPTCRTELRTPLNSLLILAQLLADNTGGNLTPKQVQFAQTIHDSGIDLLVLINDLLDLAKIESGAAATHAQHLGGEPRRPARRARARLPRAGAAEGPAVRHQSSSPACRHRCAPTRRG